MPSPWGMSNEMMHRVCLTQDVLMLSFPLPLRHADSQDLSPPSFWPGGTWARSDFSLHFRKCGGRGGGSRVKKMPLLMPSPFPAEFADVDCVGKAATSLEERFPSSWGGNDWFSFILRLLKFYKSVELLLGKQRSFLQRPQQSPAGRLCTGDLPGSWLLCCACSLQKKETILNMKKKSHWGTN